jgi:hypothetical protein
MFTSTLPRLPVFLEKAKRLLFDTKSPLLHFFAEA